jgi:hypothetical protein
MLTYPHEAELNYHMFNEKVINDMMQCATCNKSSLFAHKLILDKLTLPNGI